MRPNRHLATLATIVVLSTTQIAECSLLPRDPNLSQEDQDRERRNMILIVHAVCGFLAFQIFAPLGKPFSTHLPRQFDLTDRSLPSLAVVVASVGRSWGTVWFKIHYRIQLFVVLPLAVSFSRSSFSSAKRNSSSSIPFFLSGVRCRSRCKRNNI